eukprot:scaffold16595_cov232-Amphora_coffeaeformis.AAC.2
MTMASTQERQTLKAKPSSSPWYPWRLVHSASLDVRSLATFRVFLGVYLLYDVWSRLALGKYDLAWYTSEPPERSFLAPDDTPHKAPLHQFWFYRGSAALQLSLFGLQTLLAFCFMTGYHCNAVLKTLLFVSQVAQSERNMHMHDGSDSYLPHLLLWSCFLPLSDIWSIDATLLKRRKDKEQKRRGKKKRPDSTSYSSSMMVSGLPCLALTIQMALMYWGTVLNRVMDPSSTGAGKSQWMGNLDAVHYALSGSFATRENLLTRTIRGNAGLSQFMTAAAMLMEVGAPLILLLGGHKYRHWGALILFQLHLGLFLALNLPNWQFLGMLTQAIFVPGTFWDCCGWTMSDNARVPLLYKKTDGDAPGSSEEKATTSTTSSSPPQKISSNAVSMFLQVFFFGYMIYNWLGNRGLVAKHDRGDIGEGLRLSQYWVMYGTVGQKAQTTLLTVGATAEYGTREAMADSALSARQRGSAGTGHAGTFTSGNYVAALKFAATRQCQPIRGTQHH